MLGRGLQVTALSPDKSHRRYFDDLPAQNLSFYGSKFEDLNIDQVFDLVLMSESQNYFAADIGLKQARRYLRPGGYLLIAGLFRKQMKELAKLATYYKERTDPAVFVTHVEYLILLFQLRPAAGE